MDKVTQISKGTRDFYQVTCVVYGWGWLYTDESDLFLQYTKDYIDVLCDCFNVKTVCEEDLLDDQYVLTWETDEAITFEGSLRAVKHVRDYMMDEPMDNPYLKKHVDERINKLREVYDFNESQGDLFEWADEEERYAEYA